MPSFTILVHTVPILFHIHPDDDTCCRAFHAASPEVQQAVLGFHSSVNGPRAAELRGLLTGPEDTVDHFVKVGRGEGGRGWRGGGGALRQGGSGRGGRGAYSCRMLDLGACLCGPQ